MPASPFSDSDRAQLAERGITEDEARRQLSLMARTPRYADIARPCTAGDGIEVPDESDADRLIRFHEETARTRKRVKFVPASGAATRMFRELLHYQQGEGRDASWEDVRKDADEGRAEARSLVRFRDHLRRFAFYDDLKDAVGRTGRDLDELLQGGRPSELLDALLSDRGLAYARLPKGLLKFHRCGKKRSRTALEEHLVEAVAYAQGDKARCRLHFTISPEHLEGFRSLLDEVRPEYEAKHGVEFDVGYSVQKPSTDTLAADLEGGPFRTSEGRLLFRPGGHGALIENLNELDADHVFIKNVDNVQPDHAKGATLRWKKILGGYLVELETRAFDYYRRLRMGDPAPELLDEAMAFVRSRLHVDPLEISEEAGLPSTGGGVEWRRRFLLDGLHRPLRVCGVVRNVGEPGGGPFWVRGGDGSVSLQMVENAQIDPGSEEQQGHRRSSTHFNSVDLVCGLRDADGNRFDLRRYIDPDAVIVTNKSAEGRELKALERPGLWNGAMAGWNTVFVEVPLETFSPVKTVLDLLRDEHQPA